MSAGNKKKLAACQFYPTTSRSLAKAVPKYRGLRKNSIEARFRRVNHMQRAFRWLPLDWHDTHAPLQQPGFPWKPARHLPSFLKRG
jgi:hypothetical protein